MLRELADRIFPRRRPTNSVPAKEESTLPTIEEAIQAWESDITGRNKEGNKIVRGIDGKPVEVVLVISGEKTGDESIFGVLLNGEVQEKFQMGGEMQTMQAALGNLWFGQFLTDELFDKWYEIGGIQRLDAQVSREHQGFIFGKPGERPESLTVYGHPPII